MRHAFDWYVENLHPLNLERKSGMATLTSVSPAMTYTDPEGTVHVFADDVRVVSSIRVTDQWPPKGPARRRPKPKALQRNQTAVATFHGREDVIQRSKSIGPYQVTWGYAGLGDGGLNLRRAMASGADFYGEILNPGSLDSLMFRLRGKMSETRLDLAMTFAEFRETCSFFQDGVRKLSSACETLLAARRGDSRALGKIFRYFGEKNGSLTRSEVANYLRETVPSAWVMNSYGIQPLVGDVESYATALAEFATGDREFTAPVKFKVTDKAERSSAGTTRGQHNPYHHFPVDIDPETFYTLKQKYRRVLSVVAEPTIDREIIGEYGGIRSPMKLIQMGWELIPFSMIFDYFYDVGGWLQQVDATSGWSWQQPWLSTVREHAITEGSHYRCYSVFKSREPVDLYLPTPAHMDLTTPVGAQLANTIALLNPMWSTLTRPFRH